MALEKHALPELKVLYIHDTNIGAESMKALMAAANNGRLAKLVTLHLNENGSNQQLGIESLETLVLAIENDKLPRLRKLEFDVIRGLIVGGSAKENYMNLLNRLNEMCTDRSIVVSYTFRPVSSEAESSS